MRCYRLAKPSLCIWTRSSWNMPHLERKQKEPTLVHFKGVLFIQDNDRPHVLWVARDTIQRHCAIHLNVSTLGEQITNSSIPWKTTFVGNPSQVNEVLTVFFASKTPEFYRSWKHFGKKFRIPMGITLRTKGIPNFLYIFFLINQHKQCHFWSSLRTAFTFIFVMFQADRLLG